MPRHPRLPAAANLLLLASAGLAVGVRGQTFPPAFPPALPPAGTRDAVAAPAVKELFVVTATACEVALDGDGKVVDLELTGTGRIVAFDDTPFHSARLLGPKKFAGNFGEYFPTAESTPNAALTGLGGADEPKRAVFELEGAEFQRNGKSKNLSFSTRQTRSQARLNRLGSSSSPVALRSCSLFVDDAVLGTAGSSDRCSYNVATCAVGSICPAGTAVSADCADRSAFGENPCACTALQQLAALSAATLATEAPWNDLANAAYCTVADGYYYSYDFDSMPYEGMDLNVRCTLVDGVELPDLVNTGFSDQDLTGALPAGLGDLGPALKWLALNGNQISELPTELGTLTGLTSLRLDSNALTAVPTELGALTGLVDLWLNDNDLTSLPTEIGLLQSLTYLPLDDNAITSLPSEIAALTGLEVLFLDNNQLTGVPADFRTVDPRNTCYLFNNTGFSCANVGAGTSCCTGAGFNGNNCGEGLSGGPCYTG